MCVVSAPLQVHLLDAYDVSAPPVCVQSRQPGLEYFVEHHHGHLLLLTNHTYAQQQQSQHQALSAQGEQRQQAQPHSTDNSAADYSLYTMPAAALSAGGNSLQQWRLLRPEVPGSAVTDMDVFEGCVVLHMLHDSRPALMVLHLDKCTDGFLAVSQQHEVSSNQQC
jgi:protease II